MPQVAEHRSSPSSAEAQNAGSLLVSFLNEVYIVYLDGLVVMTRLSFGGQFELHDRTYFLFRVRHGSNSCFEIRR